MKLKDLESDLTLEQARQLIGHPVRYVLRYGATVSGIITHVTDKYVFVQHEGEPYPLATNPWDIWV